ncbi:stage V sporulation protein AD [Alicyclobacillus tolerans]|uniref:stage V sporulation protein AD n=1 Tax=Alicyclobacillus tolerans TaxID=90970 RepID=UPI001F0071CA|nr:stage V sporulation protein AD [Alicyclobacillus tolerans]MCF8563679.1 stage V sporulation protein AD [Alicyclobacillus tolerans]
MPRVGKQTWVFASEPRVIETGTVAGKTEGEGPLGEYYDIRHTDDRFNTDTWEHAEQALFSEAASTVLRKANTAPETVDLMVGGDLNAQLTSFYFGLRPLPIPALGVYSACSSITEALAIGALAVDSDMAHKVLVGTSSHNSTAERQFRYPTEYGAQKPATAQRTVTGAGMALLGKEGGNIAITAATVGLVTDFGVQSPWEMNAAMAPAAAATIETHLRDMGRKWEDYDCVATGDLGFIGYDILKELLVQRGISPGDTLTDCGMLIYDRSQPEVFAGGSGGACCTLVTFAHLFRELKQGRWKRILVSATGALLSSVSAQQSDTIPCVSHAVVFERRDG